MFHVKVEGIMRWMIPITMDIFWLFPEISYFISRKLRHQFWSRGYSFEIHKIIFHMKEEEIAGLGRNLAKKGQFLPLQGIFSWQGPQKSWQKTLQCIFLYNKKVLFKSGITKIELLQAFRSFFFFFSQINYKIFRNFFSFFLMFEELL